MSYGRGCQNSRSESHIEFFVIHTLLQPLYHPIIEDFSIIFGIIEVLDRVFELNKSTLKMRSHFWLSCFINEHHAIFSSHEIFSRYNHDFNLKFDCVTAGSGSHHCLSSAVRQLSARQLQCKVSATQHVRRLSQFTTSAVFHKDIQCRLCGQIIADIFQRITLYNVLCLSDR